NEETNKLNFNEGVEKGRAEGRAEAETKAYQEKLDMARKMKVLNLSIEQILIVTGLSKDEIEKL
ncbi:MAG: hypothetical protein MJ211_03615, partial [Bacteroidales bacterium]|nr:hypothetical protein [Bacteroidales bacterium]